MNPRPPPCTAGANNRVSRGLRSNKRPDPPPTRTSNAGDDVNPNAPPDTTVRGMLSAKHNKWQVGHENGYDDTDTNDMTRQDGLLKKIMGSMAT